MTRPTINVPMEDAVAATTLPITSSRLATSRVRRRPTASLIGPHINVAGVIAASARLNDNCAVAVSTPNDA
jgi:hypothetical protein